MSQQISQLNQDIVRGLINAPFSNNPLDRIAELGRQAFGSHTFILALLEPDGEAEAGSNKVRLRRVAVSSSKKEVEERWAGKPFSLYKDLLHEGVTVEKINLKQDGQGVTKPEYAQKYGYDAMLSCPLKVKGKILGTINHFSRSGGFTSHERELLILFANQTSLVLDWLEYPRALDRLARILKELGQGLAERDSRPMLDLVVEKACELFSVPVCIVWQRMDDSDTLAVAAASPQVDASYRKLRLSVNDYNPKRIFAAAHALAVDDIGQIRRKLLKHDDEMKQRGWVSLLSAPLLVGDKPFGLIDIFTESRRRFAPWEREIFMAFANHAALAIEKAEMLRQEQARRRDSIKLSKLTSLMAELTEKREKRDLLNILLQGSIELVDAPEDELHAAISLLDYPTGKRQIHANTKGIKMIEATSFGQGVTGRALREKKTIFVGDVSSADDYIEIWPDTKAELAVPLIVRNALVRVGKKVIFGEKNIGVLNIESSRVDAFTKLDAERLEPLARQAALLIERMEYIRKMKDFRDMERKLKGVKNYDDTIKIVAESIIKSLGFEFVYIYLVNRSTNEIAVKHLYGKLPKDIEAFKHKARHSLDSRNIQAYIVKTKTIEVPSNDDERFDKKIFDEFGHKELIRIFMPIIENNQVVGTVEAGYNRNIRPYIYERDVEFLENFIGYAAQALDRKHSNLLEKITHEFTAPVVGIRNNASYLQRRGAQVSFDHVYKKYQDMLTDCEILLHQVSELEFILGGPPRAPKMELTFLYRDIVIKTINQLQPLVADKAGPNAQIEYNLPNLSTTQVETDIAKVSAVVYNMLTNAIKYAKKDPKDFRIVVEALDLPDNIILVVKDWGIGIKPEYQGQIFDEGFRAPEAIGLDVKGSGLGLAISRVYMRQLGGDLYLEKRNKQETEFRARIPKKAKEANR